MAGSHEVRGSIPLGSTTTYAGRAIIVRPAFVFSEAPPARNPKAPKLACKSAAPSFQRKRTAAFAYPGRKCGIV